MVVFSQMKLAQQFCPQLAWICTPTGQQSLQTISTASISRAVSPHKADDISLLKSFQLHTRSQATHNPTPLDSEALTIQMQALAYLTTLAMAQVLTETSVQDSLTLQADSTIWSMTAQTKPHPATKQRHSLTKSVFLDIRQVIVSALSTRAKTLSTWALSPMTHTLWQATSSLVARRTVAQPFHNSTSTATMQQVQTALLSYSLTA